MRMGSLKANTIELVRWSIYSLPLLILGLSTYLVFKEDMYLSTEKLNKLYELGLTVSSLLFGVLGIWISIVHDEGIKGLVSGSSEERKKAKEKISLLIYPLLFSFFSIILGVTYFLISFIVQENFQLNQSCLEILKQLALLVFIFASVFQLSFMFKVLSPLLGLEDALDKTERIEKRKSKVIKKRERS